MRQEDLPRVGSVPHGMLGYGKGHGARLRAERRNWEREQARSLAETDRLTATALAKANLAERERVEVGATRRMGMGEAGLGERLESKQTYARPKQTAEIGKLGAETEKVRYGTEFEKSLEGVLKDIVGTRKEMGDVALEEAELGLSEEQKRIGNLAAQQTNLYDIPVEQSVARPGERKMRPGLKKLLWEGTPTKSGLTLPGLGAPLYGYKNIADWFGAGMQKVGDYAFPRSK